MITNCPWCWADFDDANCPKKPTFKELLTRAQTAECRVAELETDQFVLRFFLTNNLDQPMPPGEDPVKQAIKTIQLLRAEVTQLKDERDEAVRLFNSDSARTLLEALRERLCPKPDDDLVKRVTYLCGIETERDRLAEAVSNAYDSIIGTYGEYPGTLKAIEQIQEECVHVSRESDRLAEIVANLPRCWRLNEMGELVQDVPITFRTNYWYVWYANEECGLIRGCGILNILWDQIDRDTTEWNIDIIDECGVEERLKPEQIYSTPAAAEAYKAIRKLGLD